MAVTKEQSYHSDKAARAFVFSEVTDYGRHVSFKVRDSTYTIERTTFLDYIEVPPSPPADITTPEQLAPVRRAAASIQAFGGRYSQAQPLLAQTLESLQQALQAYESGLVRYQGRWISKPQFSEIQEELVNREMLRQESAAAELQAKKDELVQAELRAQKELASNSLPEAEFRVQERAGTGVFIELRSDGNPAGLCFLEDPDLDGITLNIFVRCPLYYGGTYQWTPPAGDPKVIRTYFRKRDHALSHLRDRLHPIPPSEQRVSYEPGFRARAGLVWVNGYFRADGTWVQGYYRGGPSPATALADTSPAPPKTSVYSGGSTGGPVHVRGYYRKNGTYVRPHTRRR